MLLVKGANFLSVVTVVLCSTIGAGGGRADDGQCRGIVAEESRLARDIGALKEQPICKRQRDDAGNKVLFYDAEGKLNPLVGTFSSQNDFPDELRLVVVRYDDKAPLSVLPKLDDGKFGGSSLKILKTVMNKEPGNGPAIAHVARIDDGRSSISSACIVGDFMRASGQPSRVMVCRSVVRNATDEAIFDKAREIATIDLSSITP